jgi:hypothetical protein
VLKGIREGKDIKNVILSKATLVDKTEDAAISLGHGLRVFYHHMLCCREQGHKPASRFKDKLNI